MSKDTTAWTCQTSTATARSARADRIPRPPADDSEAVAALAPSWSRRSAPRPPRPLTAALERIHALITTGKIDRAGLRALRDEVELARQAGMIGQQISRFASGRLRQSHERLQLADTLKGVLAHRHRETQARGIVLKPALKPAEVIVDASLLFSLLNTVLDWALDHARSNIEFRIDMKSWPAHAQLVCRFAHRPADQTDDGRRARRTPAALDSLTWRLLEQTAWTMGLPLDRSDDAAAHHADASSSRAPPATRSKASARWRSTTASRRRPTPSRWPAAMCWWCRRGASCACRSATRCATWA